MKAFLTEINVSEMILDSAHDAMAIYRFCLDNSINPIIDLNERNATGFKYRDNFTVGKDGVPVRQAELKMCRDGCSPFEKIALSNHSQDSEFPSKWF